MMMRRTNLIPAPNVALFYPVNAYCSYHTTILRSFEQYQEASTRRILNDS